jgi:hypothetical protein
MSSAIILAAALSSAAVGAQSGGEMARTDKMDNIKKMDAMEKDAMDKATPTFTVKSVMMVAATCS